MDCQRSTSGLDGENWILPYGGPFGPGPQGVFSVSPISWIIILCGPGGLSMVWTGPKLLGKDRIRSIFLFFWNKWTLDGPN